ncbi:MAG: DUF5908 family protein [Ginsengibacter sp.]
MPIEIRELSIKAYVDDLSGQKNEKAMTDKKFPENAESIITACVEQVLEILKNKEER